jgi:hypothetical protein
VGIRAAAALSLGFVLIAVNCVPAQIPAPRPAPVASSGPGLSFSPIPPIKPAYESNPAPIRAVAPGDMVCRDPRLKGIQKASFTGTIPGCGIGNPVNVTEIAGIKLTTAATLDCRTARTFANWLTGVADVEARRTLGARITKVWVMGTYSCRTRNNRPGARLSEHAVGRAVDVGGVWLGNGTKVTVQGNWGKGTRGQFLRTIWKKACGPFKTVLGPGADRFHQDHLHLDTAPRNSSYCR